MVEQKQKLHIDLGCIPTIPDLWERVEKYVERNKKRPVRTWGSGEIQSLAKITKMQLIHWTQTGVIIPYKDAKGRGARRRYDCQNLIEALICRELNRLRMETHIMKEILTWLRHTVFTFHFDYTYYLTPEPVRSQAIENYLNENPSFKDKIASFDSTMAALLQGDIIEKLGLGETKYVENLRHHTLWEYIRYYPSAGERFYIFLRKRIDEESGDLETDFSVFESEDLFDSTKDAPSAILIVLQELIFELKEELNFPPFDSYSSKSIKQDLDKWHD